MIPLLYNSVVKSVVTFPFLAWLGSMSPASGNWLKTGASEITGVKLPQLADNCNKQADRNCFGTEMPFAFQYYKQPIGHRYARDTVILGGWEGKII